MEIQGLHAAYRSAAATGTGKAAGAKESAMVEGKERAAGDTVSISPDAALKAKLAVASKEYAASYRCGVFAARMAALKEKYQGDACPVSAGEVAEAILARVLNPADSGKAEK